MGVGYRGPNPEKKTVNPFGAQFCELEVNLKTGEIRILRFVAAHDSGRVMNRLTYDNQVFGGIVMGIGFGLTEFRQLDARQTGKLCNRNWHDYKLPTLRKGGNMCYAFDEENQFHAIFGHDNICAITHPSDTAPPLAALGAKVSTSGPEGTRSIAVEKLHVLPKQDVRAETVLKPGELITRIELPPPGENLYSAYRKVRARRSWDFALAGLALALETDGDRVKTARVFLSGAAPVPWRSRAVEQAINGQRLDDATIAEAAEAVVREADPLNENAYKLNLFKGVVEEQLNAAAITVAA
jgi:xanthine dehydrogenase YagS FAD-binding subunit